MGTGFVRMKNYDKTHAHFKNHTIQIPRKIQILRYFNLNNVFTDITMKIQPNENAKIYMFGKDIYFFSTHKMKEKDN